MQYLRNTQSNQLTLDETISRLAQSPQVDGLALFGSWTGPESQRVSDYDLLILVTDPPIEIFQMLTHIDHHMADVVFVNTADADRVLADPRPISSTSIEGLFLQKMLKASILYDASGRLQRSKLVAQDRHRAGQLLLPSSEDALYSAWFWLNHGLYHMKRMIQSDDPVYLTAVDLMLMGALGNLCRSYFSIRSIVWEGEKSAVRVLQVHDPEYLGLLRNCLSESERRAKLQLYEQLVIRTLEPIGTLWSEGLTAVFFRDVPHETAHLQTALHYWERLLGQ